MFVCKFEHSNSLVLNADEQHPTNLKNLHVTSHDLQKYFQKHKICPAKHPEYSRFFSTKEPRVALTYEWSTPFSRILEFLNRDNISANNHSTKNLNQSLWERQHWMSFAWVLVGQQAKLPEDIGNKTIWIDILFNDQNTVNMAAELEEAEKR
jgi:hypothetical protein